MMNDRMKQTIKTKGARTFAYRVMSDESNKAKENNDCAVIATALALDIPYNEAHELCASWGRKNNKGMMTAALIAMLQKHVTLTKVNAEDMILQYPKAHQILKSVTTHHPERFNKVWRNGRYLLFCKGHVAYVAGGVTHDWTRGRAKRAWAIYRIEEE